MSSNKVSILKREVLSGKKKINKPLVISKDNFIIYGHHRWFAKKSIIESNMKGFLDDELYSENIKVVIIDYKINKLISKLQEYKIKYNKDKLSNFNELCNNKKMINDMKKQLEILENNFSKISDIKLV